ncbi:MAG: tetratricopeptide repeat protein, partial [Akkermansiaceae bacterium]|nr:tetratricopeptide repeat protein [Akkermansiaceae bacterium]
MNPMPLPTSRTWRAALVATACLVAPLAAGDLPGGGPVSQRALDQRRIDMQEAEELLLQGDQAYQAARFGEAADAFKAARGLLTDAPATRELRAAATDRFALASVERARELSRKGDVAGAVATIDAVLAPGVAPDHPAALAMRARLNDPIRTNPAATAEHTAEVDQVRRLLYTAEGAYNLGRFDDAKRHYQAVLRIDPTNSAARRGMEQVNQAIASYSRSATDQTRAEMLAQVDAAWETPVAPALDAAFLPGLAQDDTRAAMPVANKLERIILPEIMLDDASLDEAVDLLRQRSAELDTFEADPAARGINFTVEIGGNESALGNSIRSRRVKLRARNLPMSEALNQITGQTETMWTTDAFAVIIRPRGAEAGQMQTRVFRVPPNFKNALHNQAGGGGGDAAAAADPFAPQQEAGLQVVRLDVKDALSKLGVQFPEGASVSLVGNSLAVTNTPSNVAFVEAVVDSIAKSERVMAKVVVKMIRIREERLKELGVDWLLDPQGFGGASWIPGADKLNISGGTQGNGGNLGDMAVPPGSSAAPITAGNRSGAAAVY